MIVAAIFWTWVWGPIGLILSTPLTLCLVVMGRHVKSLEFFDVLLGDRPALTPIETFYQRVLADNPDEALAQAELFLSDRPLASYYDEVMVPGLKLAVDDQVGGTIDREKAKAMTAAMLSIIGDLKLHADTAINREPPVLELAGLRVATVAGRRSFDFVVATMLGQILERDGAAVRIIGNAKVARQAMGALDLADLDVILISYLEASVQPAELRYLIRRLRERAPSAKIIVGLWPDDEGGSTNSDVRRTIDGDGYFSTVRESLSAISSLKMPIANAA